MPQRIQTGNADGVGATPLNIEMKPKKKAAESISLAVWALDASKAVEKEPDPIPEPRRHGHRWLLRTLVFVGAACATFLGLAPRPAFASVVAPIACLAGLEVCGVCGPTCDAVCTH